MRKFINQVSHFRNQRGMIRLAVICTLLIGLTLVSLTIGYKKFSSAARALPVGHASAASKDCGCQSIQKVVDTEHLKGSWTPPVKDYTPEEISSMPDVLLLQAGASLPLSLTNPVNGTWKAEFGIVDPNGKYTAPPYTPPTGVDVITFEASGKTIYRTFTLHIRILPNPAIPGSSQTPYIVAAPIISVDNYGEEQRVGGNRAIVFPKSAPLPAAEFLHTVAVVQPGEKPVPPVQVTQTRSAILSGDKAAYILPTINEVNVATDAIRVGAQNIGFVPQQAKELPQLAGSPNTNPDPSAGEEKDCTGADPYFTYGTYSETSSDGGTASAGDLKADAGMQTAALPLHINVGDTIHVNEFLTNLVRTRQRFEWQCVDKQWKHTNTASCTSRTKEYFIDPQWAAPFSGRKQGYVIEPWGTEACSKL